MEGCFTFQWGWFVFQMWGGGGASFISVGGVPHRWGIGFGGGGVSKKIVR